MNFRVEKSLKGMIFNEMTQTRLDKQFQATVYTS